MQTHTAQHTPGEWTTESGDGCTHIIANVSPWPQSELPGTVIVATVPDWPACRPEQEANVRILKSAPALLEALKAMCKEFRALDLPYGSEAYTRAISVLNQAQATNQEEESRGGA